MKHPLILRLVFFLLSLLLLCSTGCSQPLPETEETADAPISSADTAEILLPDPVGATASNAAPAPSLNGWSLKDFTIVYSKMSRTTPLAPPFGCRRKSRLEPAFPFL